jgi:hypothetical protein
MSFESVGLSLNRQIRAVKAVDTPLVSTEEYRYRRLCRYSLVLGEERPSALQPILNPFRITDLLGVTREMVADRVNDPTPLNQDCWRALAETPVGEELRRRLG